jgi:hypothetical protein
MNTKKLSIEIKKKVTIEVNRNEKIAHRSKRLFDSLTEYEFNKMLEDYHSSLIDANIYNPDAQHNLDEEIAGELSVLLREYLINKLIRKNNHRVESLSDPYVTFSDEDRKEEKQLQEVYDELMRNRCFDCNIYRYNNLVCQYCSDYDEGITGKYTRKSLINNIINIK